MRKIVVDGLVNYVDRYGTKKEDLAVIRYGLESLYMNITKLIVIFMIAAGLNILYEALLFFLLFINLRLVGHGVHAQKSIHCWLASILFFIGVPCLAIVARIPGMISLLLFSGSYILLYLYAPAGTIKKPLKDVDEVLFNRLMILLLVILYFCLFLLVEDNFLDNILLFATLTETLMVLPLTYNLFGVEYVMERGD